MSSHKKNIFNRGHLTVKGPLSSIFSDKASLLLRHILAHPSRKWVARDFVNELQIGRGWAAKVMKQLREDGCLDGGARGRTAYSQLHNPHGQLYIYCPNPATQCDYPIK